MSLIASLTGVLGEAQAGLAKVCSSKRKPVSTNTRPVRFSRSHVSRSLLMFDLTNSCPACRSSC